ncbi:MAG: hypothetical protein B7Y80_10730 [Hyphomicrobium sp. 32-62-53]|nr:MAG: hypothetical protein B7Z29_10745 [Hyphomicrobium sp. 12-62-95]OYX99465.1 MAG: hypothetical protein B7Y80_10730 [Hyphomicrobium sp. 32-62-53]
MNPAIEEQGNMDLQAHTMTGAAAPQWAKRLAFVCFALACGLLFNSLTHAQKAGPAVPPSAGLMSAPIV